MIVNNNAERAGRGRKLWDAYTNDPEMAPDSPQDAISDLLHHWYRDHGCTLADAKAITRQAFDNFAEELTED